MQPLVLPFFVQVDPCPEDDIQTNIDNLELSYTINSGLKTSQALSFTQSLSCGYELTIELRGDPPSFVSFDQNQQKLTYETSDVNDEATYSFEVVGKISVPTDYTQTDF